jgi:hypothetical protein
LRNESNETMATCLFIMFYSLFHLKCFEMFLLTINPVRAAAAQVQREK